MKKELVLLVLLLSLSFISALPELSFPDKLQPGETGLGVLSGNFAKTLSSSDLLFYEGEKQIFIESDMVFYGGAYYLYAYTSRQGNFTLKINNILYKDPELKSINIVKDFQVAKEFQTINNSSVSQILSIKPGAILTSSTSKLILSNKGDIDLKVSVQFENSTQSLNISKGDFKEIPISPTLEFSMISIDSYKKFSIPVIFASLKNNTPITTRNISIVPSFLKVEMNQGQNQTKQIFFVNPDKSDIENFSISKESEMISYDPNSSLSGRNETLSINLIFSSNLLGSFTNIVNFTFSQDGIVKTITLPIEIYVFSENTTLPSDTNNTDNSSSVPSCSQLGGVVCSAGICTGTGTYSIEGYCCIGQCNVPQPASSSGSGWIIGIIIILALAAGGFFVYKKYKGTKPAQAEDTIKKKAELYEKRISGGLTRN